jgi:hypothetical protein
LLTGTRRGNASIIRGWQSVRADFDHASQAGNVSLRDAESRDELRAGRKAGADEKRGRALANADPVIAVRAKTDDHFLRGTTVIL